MKFQQLFNKICLIVRCVPSNPSLFAIVPKYYYWSGQISLIFLLASERRFQHTKERQIWILYAKVMKGESFFDRCSKIISST